MIPNTIVDKLKMTACAHIYPLTQWICIEASNLSPKAFGYCFENERSVALSFLVVAELGYCHSSCSIDVEGQ